MNEKNTQTAEKPAETKVETPQADTTPATRPTTEAMPVLSSEASLMMNPVVFEHMQRVCKVYANSDVVPQQFRGNLPNCMIAYELAHRLEVNVFMLMQAMYVVSGKPGLEAKMAIALVNKRGPFRGTIQYVIERDQKGHPIACTAWAILKATGDRCETTVTWDVVEKEGWASKGGSKWKTMPEQMFKYRSAAWLARTYCPEVLMGMHTTDELEDAEVRYVDNVAEHKQGVAGVLNRIKQQRQTVDTTATVQSAEQEPQEAAVDEQQPGEPASALFPDVNGEGAPAGTEKPQAEAKAPAKDQPQTETVETQISDVTVTKRPPAKWTKFVAITPDGDFFTFSTTIGAQLEALKGKMVTIEYESVKDGSKIVSVTELAGEP